MRTTAMSFTFDVGTREMPTSRGAPLSPATARPKEEQIRREGGIAAVGRRELAASIGRGPEVEWPEAPTARPAAMTATEQIIWAHRVDRHSARAPCSQARRCRCTDLLRPQTDRALRIHTQSDHERPDDRGLGRPRSRTITLSLRARTRDRRQERDRSCVRRSADLRPPLLQRIQATASSTSTFPSKGWSSRAVHRWGRCAQPRLWRVRRGGLGGGSTTDWASDGHRGGTSRSRAPVGWRSLASSAVGGRQGHRDGTAPAVGRRAGRGLFGRIADAGRQMR